MKDQRSDLSVLEALAAQTISTDTTTVGAIIDRKGFEAVTIAMAAATLTDGTYTPLLEEGDDSGLSDAAAVADADLIGTEAGEAFAATDDNTVKTLGYIGTKRYVRLSIVSASTSSGGALSAVAILGCPHDAPATT